MNPLKFEDTSQINILRWVGQALDESKNFEKRINAVNSIFGETESNILSLKIAKKGSIKILGSRNIEVTKCALSILCKLRVSDNEKLLQKLNTIFPFISKELAASMLDLIEFQFLEQPKKLPSNIELQLYQCANRSSKTNKKALQILVKLLDKCQNFNLKVIDDCFQNQALDKDSLLMLKNIATEGTSEDLRIKVIKCLKAMRIHSYEMSDTMMTLAENDNNETIKLEALDALSSNLPYYSIKPDLNKEIDKRIIKLLKEENTPENIQLKSLEVLKNNSSFVIEFLINFIKNNRNETIIKKCLEVLGRNLSGSQDNHIDSIIEIVKIHNSDEVVEIAIKILDKFHNSNYRFVNLIKCNITESTKLIAFKKIKKSVDRDIAFKLNNTCLLNLANKGLLDLAATNKSKKIRYKSGNLYNKIIYHMKRSDPKNLRYTFGHDGIEHRLNTNKKIKSLTYTENNDPKKNHNKLKTFIKNKFFKNKINHSFEYIKLLFNSIHSILEFGLISDNDCRDNYDFEDYREERNELKAFFHILDEVVEHIKIQRATVYKNEREAIKSNNYLELAVIIYFTSYLFLPLDDYRYSPINEWTKNDFLNKSKNLFTSCYKNKNKDCTVKKPFADHMRELVSEKLRWISSKKTYSEFNASEFIEIAKKCVDILKESHCEDFIFPES